MDRAYDCNHILHYCLILVTGLSPQEFDNRYVDIKASKQEDAHYIEALKQTNVTVINLSKFLYRYESYARFRIKEIKVTFFDKIGEFLPYRTSDEPNWISNLTTVKIGFPNEFIDVDTNGNKYTFLAKKDYTCQSSYTRNTKPRGKTLFFLIGCFQGM